MTVSHEEGLRLGLDMFRDAVSPEEIKRNLTLKGFSVKEAENIFAMILERERTGDLEKQRLVKELSESELRLRKMKEIEIRQAEKKRKERAAEAAEYGRTRN